MPAARVGDTIRVTRGVPPYYQTDTYAQLVAPAGDNHGWWANFNHPSNLNGAVKFNRHRPQEAEWYVLTRDMRVL